MRAAIYEQLGAARDVLRVVDLDLPEPEAGEVRVQMVFSGVNPTDWKLRSAGPGRAMAFGFQVPNQDGAGVIDKVGAGVDPARVGERVWLYFAAYQRAFGTAEDYVCVPARLARRLPPGASFELGASLGVPALTAAHALFCDGPLEDKTVLVQGGAGAVGHFAIELARFYGARVLTTVSSPEKALLAGNAGAHEVINYRDEDVVARVRALAPGGVDRILEVAPENFAKDVEVLAPGATVVFYASTDTNPTTPVRPLMNLNATLRFILLYGLSHTDLEAAIAVVNTALDNGVLTELPPVRFALKDIVAAHEAVESGVTGKVLVAFE